ncbi:hypothetical protein NMY22_g11152 [Coprinellus aureogranulatus]|nr:hypothetical protein NMY22_g11152 [Coprinellus aureogranulatus]
MEHDKGLDEQATPIIYHHHNYYRTVNAQNVNFGTNYGYILQNSTPSELTWADDASLPLPAFLVPIPRRIAYPQPTKIAAQFQTFAIQPSKRLLWLCGPVGCGKSAISQSVAEELEKMGTLAASFFFFRGSDERSRFSRFATTLAHQMSEAIPQTAPFIEEALAKKRLLLQGASTTTQLHRLVYAPFALSFPPDDNESSSRQTPRKRLGKCAAGAAGPFLVIIDGLDECEDRDDVADFITDLLLLFEEHPHLPLRFIIASRIEEHIRSRIQVPQVHVVNLHDHCSQADITAVVHHKFAEAARSDLVIRSYGKAWPPPNDMAALIRHADGSFIFISTLLNFILGLETSRDGPQHLTPMERFKLALNMNPGLDGLYTQTLLRASSIPHFNEVVYTVGALLCEPVSISTLSLLLGVPTYKIVNVLIPLQSIIQVPGKDDMDITFFHISLKEFIQSPQRSWGVFGHQERINTALHLVHRCLAVRLASGPSPGVAPSGSARGYAEKWWKTHWDSIVQPEFCGPLNIQSHMDRLVALSRQLLAESHLQVAFNIYLTIFPFEARLHDRQVWNRFALPMAPRSMASTFDDQIDMIWGFARRALAKDSMEYRDRDVPEILRMLYEKPRAAPDPSMHRCMVMHSMIALLMDDRDGIATRPLRERNYAIENWALHLALAFEDDGEPQDAALWNFLWVPYRVKSREVNKGYEYSYKIEPRRPGPHGPQCLALVRSNLEQAVQAIKAKFPTLAIPTNLWVGDPEHLPDGSLQISMQRDGGLSVIDMLNYSDGIPLHSTGILDALRVAAAISRMQKHRDSPSRQHNNPFLTLVTVERRDTNSSRASVPEGLTIPTLLDPNSNASTIAPSDSNHDMNIEIDLAMDFTPGAQIDVDPDTDLDMDAGRAAASVLQLGDKLFPRRQEKKR